MEGWIQARNYNSVRNFAGSPLAVAVMADALTFLSRNGNDYGAAGRILVLKFVTTAGTVHENCAGHPGSVP